MYLTGFADEAARDLAGQIRATQELGWSHIEARNIDGVNLHDLEPAAFDRACEQLAEAGISINCFGSTIANWSKNIEDPFEITLEEVQRAIPRMQRLGTSMIRIMSYAVRKDSEDQMDEERFRRLRDIVAMFTDAGLQAVHENCMNYGGLSWQHTLRLVENVPGLKLVFDTGNPLSTRDMQAPDPQATQDSWDFYQHVRDHVVYIHIKDSVADPETGKRKCTFPNEGEGSVGRILKDLLGRGYTGGISIEPHLDVVFHDPTITAPDAIRFANYVEYGRRLARLIESL